MEPTDTGATEQPPTGGSPTERSSRDRAMDRRDRLRLLMDRLERALAEPIGRDPDSWRQSLESVGAELATAFEDHVRDTEGPDGLFDEVMADNPRLAHRIDRLRDDHTALSDGIARLIAALSDPADSEAVGETVRGQGVALLADLIRHRHLGSDMLYEAYWVETSSGG